VGASEAPIYPAGAKLNAIWMTPSERGRGATLLDGGAPLGTALGSIVIAGLIAAFNSWRIAFVIAGVGTMLCGLLAWYYIRNSPRQHPSVNEAEARYIEQAHALEDAGTPPSRGGRWMAYFRYRSVWCMCLGWFFFNTTFTGLLTWMPTYLFKVHNFDIKTLGGASFIIFFSGFIGELVGGLDRRLLAQPRRRAKPGVPDFVRHRRHTGDDVDLLRGLCDGSRRRRGAAFRHAVLPAMVRNVLGHSLGAGGARQIRIPRRLHESRGQHCRRAGAADRRLHRPGHGVLLPGKMYFAAAGIGLLICSTLIDYSRKLPV
jgi:ACS family D-galactonate transporter-like MFS transporter